MAPESIMAGTQILLLEPVNSTGMRRWEACLSIAEIVQEETVAYIHGLDGDDEAVSGGINGGPRGSAADEPLARTPTFFAFSLSSSPLLEPSLLFAQRLLARPGLSLSRSRHAFRTGHSRALHTSRTRPRLHATSLPDPSRAPRTFASTITQGYLAFAPPRTVSGPTKTRFRRWHGRRTSPVGNHAYVSLSARGSC